MKLARRLTGIVSATAAAVSAAAVLLMTVGIVTDVVGRASTGRGVPGMIEYVSIILVIVVFLGMAQGQRYGAHVSMSLAVRRMPPRIAGILRLVGLIVALGFVVWMGIESGQRAWASYQSNEYRFGLVRVPVWPGRAAIPVGLGFLALELAWSIRDAVKQIVKGHSRFSDGLLAVAEQGEASGRAKGAM